jgi:hypothetical protein
VTCEDNVTAADCAAKGGTFFQGSKCADLTPDCGSSQQGCIIPADPNTDLGCDPTSDKIPTCDSIKASITGCYVTTSFTCDLHGGVQTDGCNRSLHISASATPCDSGIPCTFDETYTWTVSSTPSINCPADQNLTGCDKTGLTPPYSEASAGISEADFLALDTKNATVSGCGPLSITYQDSSSGTCTITITRTFTVTDACKNTANCPQTIKITPPTIVPSCPSDPNLAACTSQADIQTAYNTWKGGFKFTGGCSATDNKASVPALPANAHCAGASLSFKYIVSDSCNSANCTATFTVAAATTFGYTKPSGSSSACGTYSFTPPSGLKGCSANYCESDSSGTCITGASGSKDVITPKPGTGTYTVTRYWNIYDDCNSKVESATVTVSECPVGCALTMGFWKGPNGTKVINSDCGGLHTYLLGFNAFKDVPVASVDSKGNCSLNTYVQSIIQGANAGNATMCSMLRAQMLATALDVYFNNGKWTTYGLCSGIGCVDLTYIGKCTDNTSTSTSNLAGYQSATSVFGCSCDTVTDILSKADTQFFASPCNATTTAAKITAGIAKDTFDSINNGFARKCAPTVKCPTCP